MFEFQSVSKRYRDGTVAVSDLSLSIPSDKTTVIVGPSGCGKTTTLRMINRMLEPSSGTITWDGVALRSKPRTALRRQMGYVIQNGGLFPHRTVLDNVMTVPGLLGWTRAKSRKRAFGLLSDVGLDRKLAHRYPGQLSGGQQQRVGVARALAADPKVLLMDEPFSAVDPVVRADLHMMMLNLQAELHKTVIMITHDIDEAVKLGDLVVILRVGGVVAQAAAPAELLNAPADDFVDGFVGRDRGYRSLSFTPATGLRLNKVQAVRDPVLATGDGPTLVLGSDGQPAGWVDPESGRTLPVGSVFDPSVDTLRFALDAALSSPVGLAVGVDKATGRYAGVVQASDILDCVRTERVDFARAHTLKVDPDPAADDRSVAGEQTSKAAAQPADAARSSQDAAVPSDETALSADQAAGPEDLAPADAGAGEPAHQPVGDAPGSTEGMPGHTREATP